MIGALILFAITYVLMLTFSQYRPYIALGSALVFIVTGMLPIGNILGEIDFNVLMMIAGTMGLVQLFIDSKMPALLADLLMSRVSNIRMAAVALSLFAGVISAFVDNVATVLMIAPVALEICKKLKQNPVPFLIAIAVSSNLQGAATLVGDTTAIMLGGALDMTFFDFFWYEKRPGMFFIVELGAILSALIVFFLFRKDKDPIPKLQTRTKVTDYMPTILLGGVVGLLVIVSFFRDALGEGWVANNINGLLCMALFLIGWMYNVAKARNLKAQAERAAKGESLYYDNPDGSSQDIAVPVQAPSVPLSATPVKDAFIAPLKGIDFQTLGLLLGLFLMIGGIKNMGVIDEAANLLVKLGGGNVFLLFTVIVWFSVFISAFIDNIPYVATMIPIIGALAITMDINPTLLYFGLLCGATLGGNCTPVGASANITAIGILRRDGYEVKNKDFFRIGIPFTLAAITPAYILLWLFYGI